MDRESWLQIGSRLKKAVKKLKHLLSLSIRRWCLASRVGSFDDRLGLHGCIEDENFNGDRSVSTRIQQASSFASDDDIDKKAEIFIANFHRHLRLEKQASLELSYSRSRGSSFKGDKGN